MPPGVLGREGQKTVTDESIAIRPTSKFCGALRNAQETENCSRPYNQKLTLPALCVCFLSARQVSLSWAMILRDIVVSTC
eukprot:582209-Amphidinium_carterae.1